TARLLRQNKDLVGLYNIGGGWEGVVRAVRECKREPLTIFAHELNSTTRELLLSGEVSAVINQNSAQEIESAIRILMKHTAGLDYSDSVGNIRIEAFFLENLPVR